MRDGIQPRRPLRLIRSVIVLSLAAAPVVLSSGQAAARTWFDGPSRVQHARHRGMGCPATTAAGRLPTSAGSASVIAVAKLMPDFPFQPVRSTRT